MRGGERHTVHYRTQSSLLLIFIHCVGDICSVTVLGQTIILLNSAQIACDMLDKKGAIYSDRPVLQMGGELVGWKNTMVLLPYSERFRHYRRLFHRVIGSPFAVKSFEPSQEIEARRFLRQVLLKPNGLATHIRKCVCSFL